MECENVYYLLREGCGKMQNVAMQPSNARLKRMCVAMHCKRINIEFELKIATLLLLA